MNFPYTANGIGKIFVAEIVELVSFVVLGFSSGILMASLNAEVPGVMLIGMILFLLAVIAMLFSYIFNMVGVKIAGYDDDYFMTAFIAIIFEIVLAVLSAIFSTSNLSTASSIASTLQRIAGLFVTYYILTGASRVLDKLGIHDLSERGSNLAITILIMNIASCILNAMPIFTPNLIDYICYGLYAVVSIVTYILFLAFLAKTRKVLKNN